MKRTLKQKVWLFNRASSIHDQLKTGDSVKRMIKNYMNQMLYSVNKQKENKK